jgi:hypothetical protein
LKTEALTPISMPMSETALQSDLFAAQTLPEGFVYGEDRLDPVLETSLLGELEKLPFKPFEFHGFFGNRRVVSFGWRVVRQFEIRPS